VKGESKAPAWLRLLKISAAPHQDARTNLHVGANNPLNNRAHNLVRCKGMTNMNLKGNWNEIKGKLKQKYGQLTDDDLIFAEGKEDELLGRLQKRLGKSKEDVRHEIEQL
jgi:uncharacterized protein YjbJ (UPF0337 family)